MAGDWIKMRADLLTSPKVVRIASALRADRLRVIGGMHAVWCLFDVHSEDGSLDGYTPEVLDEIIGWPGFSDAIAAVQWLEIGDGFLSVPRFDEHNGQSAKRRAQEAQRKSKERAETSASDADKKRTREEKRREEKKDKEPSGSLLSASRKTKLPPEFSPNEAGAKTAEEKGLSVAAELQKFTDHHTAKGSLMADWQAAWRTWVGNAATFARAGPKSSQASIEARNKAAGEEWLRQEGVV